MLERRSITSYEDYVDIQRQCNYLHCNGKPENDNEDGIREAKVFIDLLKGTIPDSILDAGCRLGYTVRYLELKFPLTLVVGLDLVSEFIDYAKLQYPGGEFYQGTITHLPFEDNEFEYVFCSQTLEHSVLPETAAKELLRVASRGVYVAVPLTPLSKQEDHFCASENPEDWTKLFTQHGHKILYQDQEGDDLRFFVEVEP